MYDNIIVILFLPTSNTYITHTDMQAILCKWPIFKWPSHTHIFKLLKIHEKNIGTTLNIKHLSITYDTLWDLFTKAGRGTYVWRFYIHCRNIWCYGRNLGFRWFLHIVYLISLNYLDTGWYWIIITISTATKYARWPPSITRYISLPKYSLIEVNDYVGGFTLK